MISKTSKSIFIQCDWRSVYNSINWVFAKLSNFFANLKLFFFVSVAFSLYLSPINQGNQFCALRKKKLFTAVFNCYMTMYLCFHALFSLWFTEIKCQITFSSTFRIGNWALRSIAPVACIFTFWLIANSLTENERWVRFVASH